MGKCPNCGNKLSNLDVLCPKCGALVEIVQNKNNIHADSSSNSKINKPQKSEPYQIVNEPDSHVKNIADEFNDFSFIPNNNNKNIGADEPFFKLDKTSGIDADKKSTVNPIGTNSPYDQPIKADTPSLPSQKSVNDEEPYSSLHSIKNMPLPELENLDDFDPEEFIRQYRQKNKKKASADLKQENITIEKKKSKLDQQPNSLWFAEAAGQNSENTQSSLDETPKRQSRSEGDKEAEKKIEHQKKQKQRTVKADKQRTAKADKQNKKIKKKAPYSKGKIPVFLTVIIWLLIAGVLFGGFFFFDYYVKTTFGGYSSFVYEITDGKIDLNANDMSLQNNIKVSVSQTRDDDGAYAHLFKITARGGVSVSIMPLGDTFDLKQGCAQILIPDNELAKSLNLITYENQHITNDIMFEVKSKKSSYTYNIDALELFLVKAKYTRRQPQGSALTTFDNFFTLDITVLPDTKIYINELDYSSHVDKSGILNTNISLEKIGDAIFDIDIIQPGNSAVKDTFTVTMQQAQTTLVPDSSYIRIYNDAFECLGQTDPEAKLIANIEDKNYAAEIDKKGRYSILCYIDTYGLHHMQLSAVSKDKTDTDANLTIEYVPEVYAFIAEAREITIDEILIDYKTLQSIPLSVKGSMKNISIGDEVQKFVLYSQDDEMDCYYYGPLQLTQDRVYTMYGVYDIDASSFYAMYVS